VNPVDADRAGDVLDGLLTDILECNAIEAMPELVAHGTRNANAAGLGQRFQPCSDIDAIAKNIVLVDDHVAQIDADAELDPSLRRQVAIAPTHPALNLGGAQNRLDDAMEFDEHAVARRLDDAAVIFGDSRIDELEPVRLEACKRACLVGLHEPTKADHVSREDRCEPALRSRHIHCSVPSPSTLADEPISPSRAADTDEPCNALLRAQPGPLPQIIPSACM